MCEFWNNCWVPLWIRAIIEKCLNNMIITGVPLLLKAMIHNILKVLFEDIRNAEEGIGIHE